MAIVLDILVFTGTKIGDQTFSREILKLLLEPCMSMSRKKKEMTISAKRL